MQTLLKLELVIMHYQDCQEPLHPTNQREMTPFLLRDIYSSKL